MKRLLVILLMMSAPALADTVAQAWGNDGQKVRLTNEPCSAASGRAKEKTWGRTLMWTRDGVNYTGCGRYDNGTVLIEWQTPNGTDTRRYDENDFSWAPQEKKTR